MGVEKPDGCKSVVVKSLSPNVMDDDLWTLFEDCGSLSNVKVLTDRDTGASKGIAFVDFEESDDTDKAVKKSNTELKGQAIFVTYNVPREKGEKGKGKGKDGKVKGKGNIQDFEGKKQTFADDSDDE